MFNLNLPLLLLLLSSLAGASIFPICSDNVSARYYVVLGPDQQVSVGMPFGLYQTACESHGLQRANITADLIPELVALYAKCAPPFGKNADQVFDVTGMWINSYEALPKLFECLGLFPDGTAAGGQFMCGFYSMPALCEVALDAVEVISSTLTEAETVTEDVTSLLTTVFLSTETVTDYYVSRITTVITQGTSTLTTITTTLTSCSTITRTHTSTCCTSHSHHRHHECRNCSPKIQEEVDEWKNAKLVNVPLSPNEAQQSYVRCPTSMNNFYIVSVGLAGKAMRAANINGIEACAYFEYNLANITIPILNNLGSLWQACSVPVAVFNSYYGWTPLCGTYAPGEFGGLFINDISSADCNNTQWALCRAGSPIVTTLTVPTGPFTTDTIEIIRTETETVTETASMSETITESETLTVTNTSYVPVASSTSTTVPTTTVTLVSTSTTSCCCNPVVCTTIQECCKPKPSCHRPHHGSH